MPLEVRKRGGGRGEGGKERERGGGRGEGGKERERGEGGRDGERVSEEEAVNGLCYCCLSLCTDIFSCSELSTHGERPWPCPR